MFKDIRKKPKYVRQQVAFWYAVGFTTVIAFVWVLSLQYRLDDSEVTAEDEAHTGAFAQFMSELKQNFSNAFSTIETTAEPPPEAEETTEPEATTTEFILTPRATTTTETESPRRVRVEPASGNATGTENAGQ